MKEVITYENIFKRLIRNINIGFVCTCFLFQLQPQSEHTFTQESTLLR